MGYVHKKTGNITGYIIHTRRTIKGVSTTRTPIEETTRVKMKRQKFTYKNELGLPVESYFMVPAKQPKVYRNA